MNCYLYTNTIHAIGRGDVIYNLAVSKLLGDGVYVFNSNLNHLQTNFVDDIEKLLLEQSHVKGVYRNINVDINAYTKVYDMSKFWSQPYLNIIPIPKNIANSVGMKDFSMYWDFLRLKSPQRKIAENYIVFSRTDRYRDENLNWAHIVDIVYTNKSKNLYFLGLESEYNKFMTEFNIKTDVIKFIKTADLYEVAEYVYYADEVYTNQTAVLPIAQGMNKKYNLEVAPNHINCIYETPNENLLNKLPNNYKLHFNGVVEQIQKEPYNYNSEYITKNYTKINELTLKMGELRYHYLVDNIGDIKDKKVLEIGYGDGSFLKAIANNCEAYGYDITGLKVPDGVNQESRIVNSKYNIICMFDVLEHYHKINDIAAYKPDYFYISVPNCKFLSNTWFINWKHRKPNEHVYHFNKYSLRNFMDSIGYEVVSYSHIEDAIRKSDEPNNILSMIFKRKS